MPEGLTQALSGVNQSVLPAIQQAAPLAGIGAGLANAIQQYQLRQQLQDPAKLLGQINPQVQENLRQNVEGSLGPSLGSGAPALVARGVASADADYQLNTLAQYLQSLGMAGGMFPQSGDLATMLAQVTGGLGGNYSSTNAGAGDPNLIPNAYGASGVGGVPGLAMMQQTGMFT